MEQEQSNALDVNATVEPLSGPKVSSNSEIITNDLLDELRASPVFKSRDELQEWAKEICYKHGTIIVTQKSDGPSSRRNPRVILGCERGLKRREAKKDYPKRPTQRKSSTKRIGCPFKLKGCKVWIDESFSWRLEIICGVHNHDPLQFAEAHSIAKRLKPHEKDIVRDMFEVGIKPRQVLQTLKKKDPSNCTTIQTIYNARKALLTAREERSPIQGSTKCIEDSGYGGYDRKEVELILQCQMVIDRYRKSSDLVQMQIMRQIKELANPKATGIANPSMPVGPRGRPQGQEVKKAKLDASSTRDPPGFEHVIDELKSQNSATVTKLKTIRQPKGKEEKKDTEGDVMAKYMGFLPAAVAPYITHIVDVPVDGHCGFRVISALFGMGEEGWKQVRTDLRDELLVRHTNYDDMFGEERVNELLRVLDCYSGSAPPSHWMSMPDMGHLIASRYGVVLVHLSMQQCLTFLPLWTSPPADHRIVAIGYVLSSHFIAIYMADDAPIPPIAWGWKSYHHPSADGWECLYSDRSQHILDRMDKGVTLQEFPDVMDIN